MTRMVDDFLAYDAEQGPGPPWPGRRPPW